MRETKHYKGHRWTIAELKELMRLWAEGRSLDFIASKLNSTRHAISKQVIRMRKEGIPLQRRDRGHVAGRSNQLWTEAEVEYLIRRREEKATAEEIASDLGRSFQAIQGMIQKLRKEGVPIAMRGNGVRKLWNRERLLTVFAHSGTVDLNAIAADALPDNVVRLKPDEFAKLMEQASGEATEAAIQSLQNGRELLREFVRSKNA